MKLLNKNLNLYFLLFFLFLFNEFTLSYFDKSPPLSEESIISIRRIQLVIITFILYLRFIVLNIALKFIHLKIIFFLKKISFVIFIIVFIDITIKFIGFGINKHWFDENEIRFNSPYDMFSNKPNVLDHNELGFRGPSLNSQLNDDVLSIAFLGGSTGYTGTPPIPELLSNKLKKLNIKNIVYNFSVNSSNHNQHIHRLIKFLNYKYDIILFYGGNNESIQYLQYDTRPSYPYNYFIKNELSIYKIFLLKYSSIAGLIENKFGIISGINLLKKEINNDFDNWSDSVVDNYIITINKAKNLFENTVDSNVCKNPIFVSILQPVNPTNKRENKLWTKMTNAAKKHPNLLDYSYIYKDINFFDNVHIDQKSRERVSDLMSKDLYSIISNNCN